MASIHKEIIIDASPDHVWDALRDFGALHTRLVPGFVTDTKLDGDARIVTFSNGTVAREILVDCDDQHAAAGLCHRQRTHQAAQRFRAGVRRKRRPHPLRVGRRRAAERDRALYGRADGSRPARHAEIIGTQRRMMSAFSTPSARTAPRPTAPAGWISTAASSAPGISMSGNFPKTAAERPPRRRMALRLGAGGARDPGCLDRAATRRTATRRCRGQVQLVRHHAAGLRSRYRRLANSVDRPGDAEFPADDRPRGRL